MGLYPYAERYPVIAVFRSRPQPRRDPRRNRGDVGGRGRHRPRGRISGSIYSGDHEHYAFLNEAFGLLRSRQRAAARHVPERDEVRGRDHRHDRSTCCTATPPRRPVGRGHVSGGTESLMNPLLVYREWGRDTRHHRSRNVVMPVTAHPAFDKGATTSASSCARPRSPTEFVADMDSCAALVDANTVALVGSAGTYPHGADRPDRRARRARAVEHGIGLHVDGCLGGFILAVGRGARLRRARLRLPRARRHVDLAPTRTSTATR